MNNTYKERYEKGYSFLQKVARDEKAVYYEIVEDSYEYENGLLLLVYKDIDRTCEDFRLCIDLDKPSNLWCI